MKRKKKTHIILTRHGETLENNQGILQGHKPGNLSVKGIKESAILASALKNRKIDIIFCSDLKRSYISATIIAEYLKLPLNETILLRERDWGILTGTKTAMSYALCDDSVEDNEHLYSRASMLISCIRFFYNGLTVLIVGHGCINQAIIANINDISAKQIDTIPMMKNTEIVEFDI